MKLLTILIGLSFPAFLLAHETDTHVNLSGAAVRYLGQQFPLRMSSQAINQIAAYLVKGAVGEDNDAPVATLDPVGLPLNKPIVGRFMFHFLPAANGAREINDGTFSVMSTCSSLDWAINGVTSTGGLCSAQATLFGRTYPTIAGTNNKRWIDAFSVQPTTWTSNSEPAVDPVTLAPTQSGWTILGYVLHLLEDLTSPAHTRDDGHIYAFCGVLGTVAAAKTDLCDYYEFFNSHQQSGIANAGAVAVPPTPPPLLGAPDPSLFKSIDQFFNNLQSFVQGNYLSSHSVFAPVSAANQPLPSPSIVGGDDHYIYGACLDSYPNDLGCLSQGRKLAMKGARYKAAIDGLQDPCVAPIAAGCALVREDAVIDKTIALEQFSELAPITVAYAAAAIRLYAPVLTVRPDDNSIGTGGFVYAATSSAPVPDSLPSETIPCSGNMATQNCYCLQNYCSAMAVLGSFLTLKAIPDSGYTFLSWGGGDCSNPNSDGTVTIQLISVATPSMADKSCTALFGIEVKASIFGSGSIMTDQPPIQSGSVSHQTSRTSGPSTSSQGFDDTFRNTVHLTAVNGPDSTFAGWSGDCSGTNPVVTVSKNAVCVATFNETLTMTVVGQGSITVSPANITCPGNCAPVLSGSVGLTASPASTFAGWSGNCSGTAPVITLDMTAAKSCTATFSGLISLSPAGSYTLADAPGPYNVQLTDRNGNPLLNHLAITATFTREVQSVCLILNGQSIFSTNTVTIPNGSSTASVGFVAGATYCNGGTYPSITTWILTPPATASDGSPVTLLPGLTKLEISNPGTTIAGSSGTLEISSVVTPSGSGNPNANGSFLAPGDRIVVNGDVNGAPQLNGQINWTAIPIGIQTGLPLVQLPTGPAFKFNGVSGMLTAQSSAGQLWGSHVMGRKEQHPPLGYTVLASVVVNGANQTVQIPAILPPVVQDEKDIIRQEYSDFKTAWQPGFGDIVAPISPIFNTGSYSSPLSLVASQPDTNALQTTLNSLQTQFNRLFFTDVQVTPVGTPCPKTQVAPGCIVVQAGPALVTAGACPPVPSSGTIAQNCPDGSNIGATVPAGFFSTPQGSDVCPNVNAQNVCLGPIYAAPGNTAQTPANNIPMTIPTLSTIITSAYRNPQLDWDSTPEADNGAHTTGKALDLNPSVLSIPGLTKNQLMCMIEKAGDIATGADYSVAIFGSAQFAKCSDAAADHVHIQSK